MGEPSGTVTFLFTDIEGSTRLWETAPAKMRESLERHDLIVRGAVEECGGYVFATGGDGFAAAFAHAGDAAGAALAAQAALGAEAWPSEARLRVRMAMNSGVAAERTGDYFGPAVNRAARLMAVAHGGQVVCSSATAELLEGAGLELVDLGPHRLRDLAAAQQVFQLGAGRFPPLRSVDAVPTNLPVVVTELIGRDADVDAVEELLGQARLVTLTGVGGVGKTRLALAAAGAVAPHYSDGCFFVALAPLPPGGDVVRAVADAVGVAIGDHGALGRYLGERHALVVLDNCEHVLAEAASLVTASLRAGTDVGVLATSREPLSVDGEVVRAVRPLQLPGPAAGPEEVAQSAAVRLFAERASAAGGTSVLTAETAGHVAAICHHLDGIPLAIELAAARMRVMPAAEIARRLGERFRLLGGGRGAEERHRTLLATVAWSHELLSDHERRVFRRLSVFPGTFDLDAAVAVAADDPGGPDALEAVVRLVERSLVEYDAADGRYRLLETLRQFAADRLDEASEADIVRDRHAAYFIELSRQLAPDLVGPGFIEAGQGLVRDLDNLRATAARLNAARRWQELAELAAHLWWFLNGHAPQEGGAWFDQALAHPDDLDPQSRIDALGVRAGLAVAAGDFAAIQTAATASIALSEATGLAPSPYAWCALGTLGVYRGDFRACVDAEGRGLEAATQRGDTIAAVWAHANADAAWSALGERDASDREGKAALELAKQTGHPWAADLAVICHANAFVYAKEARRSDQADVLSLIEAHLEERAPADPLMRAWFATTLGVTRLRLGRDGASAGLVEGLHAADRVGGLHLVDLALRHLALIYCRQGHQPEAAQLLSYANNRLSQYRLPWGLDAWLDAQLEAALATLPGLERSRREAAGAAMPRRDLMALVASLAQGRDGERVGGTASP